MGQKNTKGAVSITNDLKRIRLRWRYAGKRYSLNLSTYSTINLLQAKSVALQIEKDMALNQFDASLKKYHAPKPERSPLPLQRPSIAKEFERWATTYKQIDLDQNVHYRSVWKLLQRWKNVKVENLLTHLNGLTIAPKTYNERLRMLRAFLYWGIKQGHYNSNPLEDVGYRKLHRQEKPTRQPFTITEIQQILWAIKNDSYCPAASHYRHSHYYPFLYFLFATGVRNGEAVGLRVKHINFLEKHVVIKESMSRSVAGTHAGARRRKDTKNGKVRFIPLEGELVSLLQHQTEGKSEDDLVFPSFTGKTIDDRMFQKRVFKPVLKHLNIPERDLYACRHTFGSRCIHEGLTPVMTAFLMGNNPETALRNYVHLVELPKLLPKIGGDT